VVAADRKAEVTVEFCPPRGRLTYSLDNFIYMPHGVTLNNIKFRTESIH
jgi:hypothetical protein